MNPRMRFSTARLADVSQAVGKIYARLSPADFPMQVVRAMERVFGSDIVTYNELPADGSAPLIVSNNGFEKENIRLLQDCAPYLPQNPLVAQMMTKGRLAPTRISDVMPFQAYQRTTIYNEWYRPLEGDYQMACGFPAEERDKMVAIAVNQKRREFSDRQIFLFGLLISHVQQAYEISRFLDRSRRETEAAKQALDAGASGVIYFDDCYRVSMISVAARLMPCCPVEGAFLSQRLQGYVKTLIGAAESEVPVRRAPLRLVLDDGSRIILRLSTDPERRRHCLMLEAERGVPDGQALSTLGLSAREAEVARWTLQGKTSWETGKILGISQRTVEKHVEKIYGKLGVSERRHLRDRVDELLT